MHISATQLWEMPKSQGCLDDRHIITPREREVLHLIAYEYSSKEIADKLYVSYETVNSHRKNLMNKLGAKNVAGLVRVACERSLLARW